MDLKDIDNDTDLSPEANAEPQEPTLTQTKVNELIGRAKQSAYDKAKREIMEEAAQQAQAIEQEQAQAPAPQQQQAAQAPQVDEEQLYQSIREKLLQEEAAQKQQQEEYAVKVNKIAQDYFSKMSGGGEMFDDYTEVMKEFDPSQFKELILLTAQMDNTLPIMYELAKNPQNLATLDHYARSGNYDFAQKLLNDLDKSISGNQKAMQDNRTANSPLDRLKPSPGSGVDGSAMSIRDYKAKYRT